MCTIVLVALKHNEGKFWNKTFWDGAKPSLLAERGITTFNGKAVTWTDKDVDDVRRTMDACAIFLYFPIYNLNDGGIGSVSGSQGSTLTTNGAPNDLLANFNPLTFVITVSLLSYVIYPTLCRFKIKFGRISRITFGFSLTTISGIAGAIVQWKVYQTLPCGHYATECKIGTGVSPISTWVQLPNYILGAMSEAFAVVTAYELAYARAPQGMRAMVLSIFLFIHASSYALADLFTPVIKDPYLIWIWVGPMLALAMQTGIFWVRYRGLNNDESMTYEEPRERGLGVDGESYEF